MSEKKKKNTYFFSRNEEKGRALVTFVKGLLVVVEQDRSVILL